MTKRQLILEKAMFIRHGHSIRAGDEELRLSEKGLTQAHSIIPVIKHLISNYDEKTLLLCSNAKRATSFMRVIANDLNLPHMYMGILNIDLRGYYFKKEELFLKEVLYSANPKNLIMVLHGSSVNQLAFYLKAQILGLKNELEITHEEIPNEGHGIFMDFKKKTHKDF